MFNLTKFHFLILTFFSLVVAGQTPTVGLLHINSHEVSDGYTLFTPELNKKVFLVNNCGEKVNTWTFNERPGATCYLLENGNLLRAGKDSLQIRDWNNNVIWSYATSANGLLQHHDIEPLPNGNILCILSDIYSVEDMIAAGRNPALIGEGFKLEKIVELRPVGSNNANIVWEWKFKDHLIQDFDPLKLNYGTVLDYPERIDINYNNGYDYDWVHFNGIDYNATLDQIIVSARHLNEIYIIDHSTTTAEAAGHTGGNFNKGGDILWRWGNPQVYRQGTSQDQKLFVQHDPKWVETGYLDEGKISVFNNGGNGSNTFSSVHLISPEIIDNAYTLSNNRFSPSDFFWSWSGSFFGVTVYEDKKSGIHLLPNGNAMICETALGRISEINKNGDHLWSYKNPSGTITQNQFAIITDKDNAIFRGEKYPPNYPGLIGKDLTSKGLIENENSLSVICFESLGENDFQNEVITLVNPMRNNLLQFETNRNIQNIRITDMMGKTVFQKEIWNENQLTINLVPSLYLVHFIGNDGVFSKKLIVE